MKNWSQSYKRLKDGSLYAKGHIHSLAMKSFSQPIGIWKYYKHPRIGSIYVLRYDELASLFLIIHIKGVDRFANVMQITFSIEPPLDDLSNKQFLRRITLGGAWCFKNARFLAEHSQEYREEFISVIRGHIAMFLQLSEKVKSYIQEAVETAGNENDG